MPMKRANADEPKAAPQAPQKFGGFNRAVAAQRKAVEFVRDEAYEASPGIAEALAVIDGGAPAVLIAGRAGTG
jgi:hypothetical protein